LVVGDFNEDGAPDIAATNSANGTITVFLGNGNGTFVQDQTFAAGTTPQALAVGDFNGDGLPDLVSASAAGASAGSVNTLLNVPPKGDFDFAVIRLNTDGSFDNNFNGNGKVAFTLNANPGGANDDEINSIIIQPNSSIMLGGFAQTSASDRSFAMARLTPAGQLDDTFGIINRTINQPSGLVPPYGISVFGLNANPGGFNEDVGTAMVRTPRGDIVIAGYATTATNGNDFAIARVQGLNWIPIVGDWDGDGVETPGLYDTQDGTFFLKSSFTPGDADITFSFGPAGYGLIPIVGKWTANATHDSVGLFDPTNSVFLLVNSFRGGAADIVAAFGPPDAGWLPLSGNFNPGLPTSIGLFAPQSSTFLLNNTIHGGKADNIFVFGPSSTGIQPAVRSVPLTGDWTGKGFDSVGIWTPVNSVFYLDNQNATPPNGAADITFQYGPPNGGPFNRTGGIVTNPLIGRWTGNSAPTDGLGLYVPSQGFWQLKNAINGNPFADITFFFGPIGVGGAPQIGLSTGSATEDGSLTQSELDGIVANALARYESLGLSTAQLSRLASANFAITNLPDGEVGFTADNDVFIDATAGGAGWFVDPTPGLSEEFANGPNGLTALPGSSAAGHMDLLTVVLHEMGHVLGMSDLDPATNPGDLMDATLSVGQRRVDVLDALFAQGLQ
jgi:uncharacterized delta-60 repeat protein